MFQPDGAVRVLVHILTRIHVHYCWALKSPGRKKLKSHRGWNIVQKRTLKYFLRNSQSSASANTAWTAGGLGLKVVSVTSLAVRCRTGPCSFRRWRGRAVSQSEAAPTAATTGSQQTPRCFRFMPTKCQTLNVEKLRGIQPGQAAAARNWQGRAGQAGRAGNKPGTATPSAPTVVFSRVLAAGHRDVTRGPAA